MKNYKSVICPSFCPFPPTHYTAKKAQRYPADTQNLRAPNSQLRVVPIIMTEWSISVRNLKRVDVFRLEVWVRNVCNASHLWPVDIPELQKPLVSPPNERYAPHGFRSKSLLSNPLMFILHSLPGTPIFKGSGRKSAQMDEHTAVAALTCPRTKAEWPLRSDFPPEAAVPGRCPNVSSPAPSSALYISDT